jgi:putative ABC transport system permease protein
MSLLDRKLLRDLRALKSQALAVALVMACGLAMMIMTRSLILSLDTTRDTYYRENRFGEVFARLKRAPNAVREQLVAIPGVAAVQTGIAIQVTLDVPGLPEPAVGLINSLPERGEPVLNRPYVRAGRLPLGRTTRGELAVGEAFAESHGLKPGDTLAAILNGTKQTFRLSGIVLSPEFVFEAPPGAALPDNKTYGVFWMPYKELATAFQLYGAFNNVSLTLAPAPRKAKSSPRSTACSHPTAPAARMGVPTTRRTAGWTMRSASCRASRSRSPSCSSASRPS